MAQISTSNSVLKCHDVVFALFQSALPLSNLPQKNTLQLGKILFAICVRAPYVHQ
jgi:hypothetical protein